MEYYMPTRAYAEPNCIAKHGEVFAWYGTKAMIVTGKNSSRANGSLNEVINQLKSYGISYVIFDEVEENPSVETVMKAREIGIKRGVEYVIGIGGGSPMDAAKAIAVMIKNHELGREALFFAGVELPYLPVIEIPTTAGTGSEVTPWSVLTIHEKRTKSSISQRVYPAVALIDSQYLRCVPRYTLVATAIDTLAHLVESQLVTASTEYSRIFSERGLCIWGGLKDKLLEDKLTEPDYDDLMNACTLGGMAITHTSTGIPHALSYRFTYDCNIAHGIACGLTLGGFVKHYRDKEKTAKVLSMLGFETAKDFCDYLKKLIGPIELPEGLWKSNADALMANEKKLATYPYELSREELSDYCLY